MAHDIYSGKFYTPRAKPAWHTINILNDLDIEDKPRAATEVLALIGESRYEMLPTQYEFDGISFPTGDYAIIRHPEGNETKPQVMGVVGEDYSPIYPSTAAAIWDAKVGIPVETFGILANGAKVFISGVLPKINVKGEDVETFLVLYSPLTGNEAATGLVAATRVVCQNTLHMALGEGKSKFRVPHSKGAALRLGNWLQDTYQGALLSVKLMQENYNRLAAKKVDDVQIQWIAEQVYKFPAEPKPNDALLTPWAERMEGWEYRMDWTRRAHKEINLLFNGKGYGLDNADLMGTAWYGLQAFSEFATYRRGTMESMAHNVLVGDRAREIRKSYSLLLAVQ